MKNSQIFYFLVFISLYLFSCQDEVIYSPKPRAYPKVIYPGKSYQKFDKDYCKFIFEYPTYANVKQEKTFFEEAPIDPCWFDLDYESLNATIHCSYYPLDKKNTLEKLKGDAFSLAGKHNVKANYIDELPIKKPNNVEGFVFDIDGPVASPFQFYLTNGSTHFMRASLYFNTQIRPDSIAPVLDFIKEDMMHMVNTFEWTEL